MKSTGIVRKVDELGRIVLPIELRRTLDISEKDALEIYVEGDSIILRKDRGACVFCAASQRAEMSAQAASNRTSPWSMPKLTMSVT